MHLSKWMQEHKVSDSDLARALGVTVQAAGRYRKGERRPHPKIMARLHKLTKRRVGPADFYDLADEDAA